MRLAGGRSEAPVREKETLTTETLTTESERMRDYEHGLEECSTRAAVAERDLATERARVLALSYALRNVLVRAGVLVGEVEMTGEELLATSEFYCVASDEECGATVNTEATVDLVEHELRLANAWVDRVNNAHEDENR